MTNEPSPLLPEGNLLTMVAAGEPGAARLLLDETGALVYGFVFARGPATTLRLFAPS